MKAIKTTMHLIYTVTIVLWTGTMAVSGTPSAASGPFDLTIETKPDSAGVSLDDSARGVTPCTLDGVGAGKHTIILRKKGCYGKKVEIVVDSASPKKFTFELLKPATLWIISEPPGALLTVDGKNEGLTPWVSDKVKPGDHPISLKLKGYLAIERTVSVQSAAGDTVHIAFTHSARYRDSVATIARAAQKAAKEHQAIVIVSAIFCLVAIVLIMIETGGQ
jgi:hypothetical protein